MKKKIRILSIITIAVIIGFGMTACPPEPNTSNGEKYTVTFDSNGGNVVDNQTINEGEKAERPNDPVKENFVFDDWYSDEELQTVYDFNNSVINNITLYAKWLTLFTISFESNDGSDVPEQIVGEGKTVSLPQNPSKTGFGFAGWFIDEDCTEEYDFDTPVTDDFILYAAWDDNYYIVNFNSMGGSEVESQNIAYNSTATRPDDPAYSGWGFYGWYIDEYYTEEYDFDTPVTEGITLYAKWGAKQYTITFNTRGGSEVPSQTVAYGGWIERPENPTNGFYDFVGWYKDADLTQSFSIGSYTYFWENEDITLYAKWRFNAWLFEPWLEVQDGGDSPDNPIEVSLTNDLSSMSYRNLLLIISPDYADKYVALDLSACTTGDTSFGLVGYVGSQHGMKKVVSLVLPDTLTGIHGLDGTLTNEYVYTNLKSVSGKNIKTIEGVGYGYRLNGPFTSCTALASVDFPNLVTINSNYAFRGCTSLTSIDFHNLVTIGGSYAFEGCTSLTSLDFPSLVTIGGYSGAFSNCTALESVYAPKVTTIDRGTFEGCVNLANVEFPNLITIGVRAFQGCISLVNLDFPNVITIEDEAFYSYIPPMNLENINFPKVTYIGKKAFSSNPKLTSVTISANATSIADTAFVHCNSINSFTVVGSGPAKAIENGKALVVGTHLIAYPTASGHVSLSGITSIGGDAFTRCMNLTSVSFPDVITINDGGWMNQGDSDYGAFAYCTNLTSVDFPKAESIGSNAFFRSGNISSINFPELISIGEFAFQGLRLTAINNNHFPKVTTIKYRAFYGSALVSINFPEVVDIGVQAFMECTSLSSIIIPKVASMASNYGVGVFARISDNVTITMGNAAPIMEARTIYHSVIIAGFEYDRPQTITLKVPAGATGYGTIPATYSGIDNTQNWGNAFRGMGWDGTNYLTGSANSNITLNIVYE